MKFKFIHKIRVVQEKFIVLFNLLGGADIITAVRRRHGVGGGAPVNFGRWRRAAGPKKVGGGCAAVARRRRPSDVTRGSRGGRPPPGAGEKGGTK